jgi:hypothetical protein
MQIAIARFLSHSHGDKVHIHRVTRSGLAAERQKIAHELGLPSLTHDSNGNPINEQQQATRAIDRFLKTRGVDAKDNAYTRGDLAQERKRIAQELGVRSLMHPGKVCPNAILQLYLSQAVFCRKYHVTVVILAGNVHDGCARMQCCS